jgi:hypothetical protein
MAEVREITEGTKCLANKVPRGYSCFVEDVTIAFPSDWHLYSEKSKHWYLKQQAVRLQNA